MVNDLKQYIGDENFKTFCQLGKEIEFPRNTTIFNQDDIGETLYFLKEGRVAIEIDLDGKGQKTDIATIDEGELFGEMTFFDKQRRSATVRSKHDKTIVIEFNKHVVLKHFDQYPEQGYAFMKFLAARLAHRVDEANFQFKNLMRSSYHSL